MSWQNLSLDVNNKGWIVIPYRKLISDDQHFDHANAFQRLFNQSSSLLFIISSLSLSSVTLSSTKFLSLSLSPVSFSISLYNLSLSFRETKSFFLQQNLSYKTFSTAAVSHSQTHSRYLTFFISRTNFFLLFYRSFSCSCVELVPGPMS